MSSKQFCDKCGSVIEHWDYQHNAFVAIGFGGPNPGQPYANSDLCDKCWIDFFAAIKPFGLNLSDKEN